MAMLNNQGVNIEKTYGTYCVYNIYNVGHLSQ